ncbi:kinesin heavy chain [Gloeopeniophorella convolvens]|nr:kinesin heavy chain [Gloeopeniophorella convolvens]
MASNNIKVICRFRPPNALEAKEGSDIIVAFDDNLQTVQLRSAQLSSGPERDGFTFDRVFPMGTKQHEVFDYGVKDIVKDVLDGYNGTVFAYGQTGSGKTFTMMGADIDSDDLKGIIPRITEQIFQSIVESDAHLEYFVKVSYMEIYLERIRDLLQPQNDNLQVHEEKSKGVYVKNLSDYYVSSAREVYEIMRQGGAARVVTSTNMNAESSRSHSIFLITISQRNTETGAQKTGNLYLVDLAGSEKVGKTGASGQTLEEAKKINKSLSALGMVINALTDSKAKHIPYRDSKLTRILQESLGGNSRTTLIINCSPASFNESETLSTLRFGIRAKSIKNTARVNAELSPLELKGLLQKAQISNASYQKQIAALDAELAIWRAGGSVDPSEYASASNDKAGPSASAPKKAPASPTPSATRSATPVNPALEGLKELDSRPQTPTVIGLDKDEREEFLKRENELSDQLAEREGALVAAEKLVKELKEELAFLKEQEAAASKENKSMSTQINELRLQVEKLDYDNKEGAITVDILKEQNTDAKNELEELKRTIADLKSSQKDPSAEDKEKRKQEKMALMMAQFDMQGTSEKDEQLRLIMAKLDAIESDSAAASLTSEEVTQIRRQLAEGQSLVRETVDRLRQKQEESELITRRKDELESRLSVLETEYEELLEKIIHDEETSNADLARSTAELKNKLEAQYAAKRESHVGEVADLKQQLEMKGNEVRSLNASIDSLKSVNEELKRAFAVTSAGIEGGKNLAESAQDLERTRKAINVQLAEFDGVKKSLMRDLQNRCEKVVELEIQLDEIREQYNNVIRNSNSKAQQKKMAFLERNLEQLTLVQKQLVDQNSALKKEAGIAERKLLARNERIQNLEALLQDADRRLALQNQKFEAQLQAVKDRLDQARAQKAAVGSPLSFAGRIAKPLRGGGGAAAPNATSSTPASATVSANPLARVQNEESGGKFYAPRVFLMYASTHHNHRQARIVVLPISVNTFVCSFLFNCHTRRWLYALSLVIHYIYRLVPTRPQCIYTLDFESETRRSVPLRWVGR